MKMSKWEYQICYINNGQPCITLNEWGQLGWELILIDIKGYAYFRRKL